MFKKNIKPILMAGALALATAVSPVLANTPPEAGNNVITTTNDNNGNKTFQFTKTFTYAKGITFPNPTFTYAVDGNSVTGNKKPIVTISDISFTDTDKKSNDTDSTVRYEKNGTITISLNSAVPGEYIYTIKENSYTSDDTQAVYVCDSDIYELHVYVTNIKENGVESVGISKVTLCEKYINEDGNVSYGRKVTSLAYENSYKKDTGSTDAPAFTVTKTVKGDFADKQNDIFDFKITFDLPNDTVSQTYTGTSTVDVSKLEDDKDDGDTSNNKITYTITDNRPIKFQLQDGDTISFPVLPAGTTYTISENNLSNGYALTEVKVDGVADNDQLVSDVLITDTNSHSVEFTNTKKDTPITGVIVNNMPYIALLGASGAGLVVLAASKKRSKK